MTTTHYRLSDGGDWFALVHGDRALLVEATAERALELWPALVEGADALLDRLTAQGLSAAPSFAFVEADAPSGLRTILRGPVAATVSTPSGSAERSGAGVATWREDADASATAVRLRRDGVPAGGAPLPLVSGIVPSSAIELDLVQEGVALPAASSAPLPAAEPGPAPIAFVPTPPAAVVPPVAAAAAPVVAPAVDLQPFTVPPFAAPAPTPAAPAASAAQTPVEPDEDDAAEADAAAAVDDEIDERTSVLPPRRPAAEPAPEQTVLPEQTILPSPEAQQPAAEAEAAPAPAADEYDYLFGSTVVRTVADAAVRDDEPDAEAAEAPAEPGPLAVPAAGDHDGHTIMAADLAELRARRREQGAAPAAPVPAPTLHLLRYDGVVESLDQPVLVGRAPSVSQVPGGRMPRLVTVNSLGQDISRNHVQFTVEGGTVVVTDLHSRNGTHIVLPGKSPQKLRQGEPTAVIVGSVIDLGGGVTFTVSED